MAPLTKALKSLASLKLTVVCHIIFIILVVWGTWYQRDHGLYAAKTEFFTSWFFWLGDVMSLPDWFLDFPDWIVGLGKFFLQIAGFIPFPGGTAIMATFFINLLAVFAVRFKWYWRNAGLILTHLGLLMLCVGSGWVYLEAEESNLMIVEGEQSEYTESAATFELALWPLEVSGRRINAFPLEGAKEGRTYRFERHKCNAEVLLYYPNAKAFGDGITDENSPINSSGITRLIKKERKEERAFPGAIFNISNASGKAKILLFGGEIMPTQFLLGEKLWQAILRPVRHKLPATFRLLDAKKEVYEGTGIARGFESHLEIIESDGTTSETRISMNNPLQYKGFTFFQSGMDVLKDGSNKEYTVLAVVENPGRLVPYISSLIIALGVLVHFVSPLFTRKRG